MTKRLLISGGVGAIYDYAAGNDNPLSDPLGNISRLYWHSSLRYPAVIETRTGLSVTLPAVAANAKADVDTTYTATLFAHGRSGIPYVEGKITAGLSAVVGLCGSVPVQRNSGTVVGSESCFRVVSLGANATHVLLNAYGLPSDSEGFSALSLTLTVYVLDVLLT